MLAATAKCNMDWWTMRMISKSTGINGPRLAHQISFAMMVGNIIFSEKVLKKFIDNFYCWKLRYRCDISQLYVKQLFRDRSDAMFYSRRLTSLFGPGPHKNFSCSDCYRNLVDRIDKPKLSKKTFPINVLWPIRIKQRLSKGWLVASLV